MKISTTTVDVTQLDVDAVIVGVAEGGSLTPAAQQLDQASGGAISKLVSRGVVKGKRFETATLLAPAGISATQALIVGMGEPTKLTRGDAFRIAAAAAKSLAAKPEQRVGFYLGDGWPAPLVEAAACGFIVGGVGQDLYRAEKKLHGLAEVHWAGDAPSAAIEAGIALGESMNLTRRLVNEPPSHIFPAAFAAEAERVASDSGLEIEVWDEARLTQERCGSLLAVARGSSQPPRLVILSYRGGGESPTLGLVGKGVTFDSGGLSLKPSDSMKTMKCDMAGAATVLGTMAAIARLKLPVNVIGLVGLVENMISGDSYKLGDVLTARCGKTIEVLNTDAEGRLVLADVLDVAVERGAANLIDLATLTGACVVALGMDVSGLMTNHQDWCGAIAAAAADCGERVWQLPMFPEFGEQIRSTVADIKNIGDGRWGGAITAAKFLEEFVAGTPWTHIDIAGPAFLEKPKEWLDAGGSGALVRTLVEVARGWPANSVSAEAT
ncbi:MAG: leucyl aminopeptidase [Pirellulaceae bacterium]